nr:GNAT family N-acetyltransferase [Halomarina salina]
MPVFSTDWVEDLHDVERVYLPTGDFLVVEADDGIVATGGLLPETDDTVRLVRVRVLPEWRETEVVADLLAELESLARGRGFDSVVLDTNERLAERNRAVESSGYELTDRRPLPEWGVDLLVYRKSLD